MDRSPDSTRRRARDLTGLIMLIIGVIMLMAVTVAAAYRWGPLPLVAVSSLLLIALGVLLGRE